MAALLRGHHTTPGFSHQQIYYSTPAWITGIKRVMLKNGYKKSPLKCGLVKQRREYQNFFVEPKEIDSFALNNVKSIHTLLAAAPTSLSIRSSAIEYAVHLLSDNKQ